MSVAFKKHDHSKAHHEAVEAVITLPKTTKDVGELLDRAHRAEKEQATSMLLHILSSIQYLARQGLALQEDDSDATSNLMQLLRLSMLTMPTDQSRSIAINHVLGDVLKALEVLVL